MMRLRFAVVAALGLGVTGLCSAAPVSASPAHVLPPQAVPHVFKTKANARPTRSNNLFYNGGVAGIGVETSPKVYLVLWGSQWSNDPSGEASREQSFLQGVGGSSWLNSVTQYCQNVPLKTFSCSGISGAQYAGNPSSILAGTWNDNGSAAPSSPSQSDLAAEAVRAAQHFGNATSSSNVTTQYVIATAHGNNASGFGTQYCAWHSSTSSSVGNVAYTNLPYITDAGASCGANFNGLGPNAGMTIVEGHELGATTTVSASGCTSGVCSDKRAAAALTA